MKAIEKIEAGILKEVSVGCAISAATCSICGSPYGCCEHQKGATYDGKQCVSELSNPVDAYEFSFVAVPAQPGAGVTKSTEDISHSFEVLMTADLSGEKEKIQALMPVLQLAMMPDQERLEREAIRKSAEAILKITKEKEGK